MRDCDCDGGDGVAKKSHGGERRAPWGGYVGLRSAGSAPATAASATAPSAWMSIFIDACSWSASSLRLCAMWARRSKRGNVKDGGARRPAVSAVEGRAARFAVGVCFLGGLSSAIRKEAAASLGRGGVFGGTRVEKGWRAVPLDAKLLMAAARQPRVHYCDYSRSWLMLRYRELTGAPLAWTHGRVQQTAAALHFAGTMTAAVHPYCATRIG